MFRAFLFILLSFLYVNEAFTQNTLVSSGLDKLQKKKYKEALSDFNSALKEDPTNIEALSGSALAQNGLDNNDEALKIIESVLKDNPQNYFANYVKGEILIAKKNYTAAIESFNKAIGLKNNHFASIIGKSKAFNLMGDTKEAYKILDNAILEFPNTYEIYLARGILNNSKEKYAKALNDFDMAINSSIGNSNLNNYSVYFNRGIAYSALEEYESAIEDLNKACEIDPSNANAFYSRGLANYQLGNYENSVQDFIKSDQLNPNNSVTYYNLGMAYYKLDDVSNACPYFHKACGMNNTNACKMIIMVCTNQAK
jgi:tetratricopeptide (TPR) repeat protein